MNDRVSWSRGGNDRGGDYSDYVDRRSDNVSRSCYYDRSMSPPSDFGFRGRRTSQGYRNSEMQLYSYAILMCDVPYWESGLP